MRRSRFPAEWVIVPESRRFSREFRRRVPQVIRQLRTVRRGRRAKAETAWKLLKESRIRAEIPALHGCIAIRLR